MWYGYGTVSRLLLEDERIDRIEQGQLLSYVIVRIENKDPEINSRRLFVLYFLS